MRSSDLWYVAWRNAVFMIHSGKEVYQTLAALAQSEYVMNLALEAVYEKSK